MSSNRKSSKSPSPSSSGRGQVNIHSIAGDQGGELVDQLRRKIVVLEQRQADLIRSHNQECVELQTHVVDLRAALEKSEAERQQLGYEFDRQAVASREQIYTAANKEASFSEVNAALQGQVAELKQKITEQAEEAKLAQEKYRLQQEKAISEIKMKRSLLEARETEKKALQQEIELFDIQTKQQAVEITHLKKRLETVQSKLDYQLGTVQKQACDLEARMTLEKKMKREVETTYTQLHAIEEKLELERTAHLESNFNSEIVQLRVRDLEAALESEKVANGEANMNIDMLKQQLKDIKQSLETEQRIHLSLGVKIEEQQREWVGKEMALTAHIEEKQSVISSLSEQLDHHEKNFRALKVELSQAKQKQRELEDTYVSCVSELERMVRKMQAASGSPDSLRSSTLPPAAVLSSLKHLLTNYQSKLADASSQLSTVKLDVEHLKCECERYKETLQSKEIAVKDLQKSVYDTHKEAVRSKSHASERDEAVAQLTKELERKSHRLKKEKEMRQSVKEELKQIRQGVQADAEAKCQFLRSLYERLLAGRVVLDSEHSQTQLTWSELTTVVAEQVSSLLFELERLQNKVEHVEGVVKRREEALNEATISHQQGLNKLSQAAKQREIAWQQQRRELETHYSEVLQELQSKAEKTQSMADQAWERLHHSDRTQQGLEDECLQLRSKVDCCEAEAMDLQIGCGLLSGGLLSVFNCTDILVTHKIMLSERCQLLEELQDRISLLVGDLCFSNSTSNDSRLSQDSPAHNGLFHVQRERLHKPGRSEGKRPVMKFRVGVIAVLAANRLFKLGQLSSILFTDGRGVSVVAASNDGSVLHGGNIKHSAKSQSLSERFLCGLSWLSSAQCRRLFTYSLSGISEILSALPVDDGDMHDSASNPDTGSLQSRRLSVSHFPDDQPVIEHAIGSLRSAFSRTFSALLAEFPGIDLRGLSDSCLVTGQRESTAWSLVQLLRRGLHKLLHKSSQVKKAQTLQDMDQIEQCVTELVGRLRDCEVERCGLQSQLTASGQEVRRLREACQQINVLQTTVKRLEDSEDVIPKEAYDRLVVESQRKQQYAREQETRVEELTLRTEHMHQDLLEKEATLAQAIKDLADLKMEVQRQGESAQQMNRRISRLKEDKWSLKNELQVCQVSLQAASREKDLILEYLLSVDKVLQTTVGQVSAHQLVNESSIAVLKLPKLKPSDHAGLHIPSHIAACEAILCHVTDFHHQAATALASLRAEIESHRAHAAALQVELTRACLRQIEETH